MASCWQKMEVRRVKGSPFWKVQGRMIPSKSPRAISGRRAQPSPRFTISMQVVMLSTQRPSALGFKSCSWSHRLMSAVWTESVRWLMYR